MRYLVAVLLAAMCISGCSQRERAEHTGTAESYTVDCELRKVELVEVIAAGPIIRAEARVIGGNTATFIGILGHNGIEPIEYFETRTTYQVTITKITSNDKNSIYGALPVLSFRAIAPSKTMKLLGLGGKDD